MDSTKLIIVGPDSNSLGHRIIVQSDIHQESLNNIVIIDDNHLDDEKKSTLVGRELLSKIICIDSDYDPDIDSVVGGKHEMPMWANDWRSRKRRK